MPRLKVTAAREVAAAIADLPPLPSGERRIVVGPSRITQWLPTFPDHPFPLIARKTYFYTLGPGLERRIRVKQYVTGKYLADGPDILRQAIRDERRQAKDLLKARIDELKILYDDPETP